MEPLRQSHTTSSPLVHHDSRPPNKRESNIEDEPPAKKIRPGVEVPAVYSDAVRKKLLSTSRTGQACDRCKERKMKCDTDPIACQPCRQKNLRCYTTDRVTGQSRERGQTDRAESELQALRDQNAAYRQKYGPLDATDYQVSGPLLNLETNSGTQHVHQPPPERDKVGQRSWNNTPDSRYIGWPAPLHAEPLHSGPINGTVVDILDGYVDIADFECEAMDDYSIDILNKFNMSRTSVLNTLTGYQTITDPRFPTRDQALQDAKTFLIIMAQYVPIVHGPSFISMVQRIYDDPNSAVQAERVQLAVVLAIVAYQCGTRNHQQAAEKFEQSHYYIHYALTYYRELLRDKTLAAMQALALILVHFRNLPKPGYTWSFGHNILVKAMDAGYHRDPDRIELPPGQNNLLSKELRKRVFHSILGICVTTGCRVGRPAPWQFSHMDVPLPLAIKDSEISEAGLVTPLSGLCDFWPCLHLAKLLPLLTEMYNNVTSVRRSEPEFLKTIEALQAKVDAWRRDWDESIRKEEKHVNLIVATLLFESWTAEYGLNLYHPSLCHSLSAEAMDRHLDMCHKHAQRLLKSFHILSGKYKGVDFTWHSTVAYALGFGVTLHVYQQKKACVTTTQFESMRNELKGWMSLMAYADLVLRTKNHLQHIFEPRVRKVEADYKALMQNAQEDQTRQQAPTPTNPIPSTKAFVKPDPSPHPSPASVTTKKVGPHQDATPLKHTMVHLSRPQSTPSSQAWAHPMQFSGPTRNGTPNYDTYVINATQYSPLPTSLAPILNDQPKGYVTYQAPNSNVANEMMIFQPALYTDGQASTMWPMITLPSQEQHAQHELKY